MPRAKESQQGQIHMLADAEFTRFRCVVPGSDDDHVKYPALGTDVPLGVLPEGTEAAEDHVAIRLCGYGETAILKMSGTGSKGDAICPAVDGTGYGRAIPSSGQVYAFAVALEDWEADQEIAVQTFNPIQVDGAMGTGARLRAIVQTIAFDDLTDGGSTSGTLDLDDALPAGAKVLGGRAVVATGFTGDTSAALDVGTASDPDAFVDNISVLAAATVWGKPADDSLLLVETTVQATITGAADFGSIAAGSMVLTLFYIALA